MAKRCRKSTSLHRISQYPFNHGASFAVAFIYCYSYLTFVSLFTICIVIEKNIWTTGARYEDLMIDEPDVVEALKLADPEVLHGRMRRLKRASDLSFKAKSLPDYAPNMVLEPFKEEFYDDLLKIRKRDEEFEMLNYHKK
jgi:Ubiquinol-cytochrome C reductase complex 14kD subunit